MINIIKSNNTLNEYDLLSEDSVFNPSKHTSNNVTNNNSKDKKQHNRFKRKKKP